MTVKECARQVIDGLPENASMDDIIHALYINIKFAHGVEEIRNGKGISHNDSMKRLGKWLK
jgi:hypothetical protein